MATDPIDNPMTALGVALAARVPLYGAWCPTSEEHVRAFASGVLAALPEGWVLAQVPAGCKLVAMSDELFEELGATRVEWGEPVNGGYTPTVYR